jgi:hypothetical protein
MAAGIGVAALTVMSAWSLASQASGASHDAQGERRYVAAQPPLLQEPLDPADFSTHISNPLFPISLTGPKVFDGEEEDDEGDLVPSRLESRVLPQTKVVAGVTTAVLEEKAYVDGVIVEVAFDYFAQHRDGSVWYFGEDVDNYEDGVLKDHASAWLAGVDGAQPGIIMPASPVVGQTFQQERAPGVAEDEATVLALNETVTVPAGTYTGCMKTEDRNPLENNPPENKWHCPGIGLVREEGEAEFLELTSVAPAPAPSPSADASTAAPAATAAPSGIVAPATGSGGHLAPHQQPYPAWLQVLLGGALALGFAVVAVRLGGSRR